jgi:hypothetical protein
MSIKNQYKKTKNDPPEENTPTIEQPKYMRNQLFREDLFKFENQDLENRVLKICGDNRGHLLLFKKAIFFTHTFKDESNYYEWNTSLRGHNYTTGKYDIDLQLNLNKDVPDTEHLSPGKYKIVLKFYNPHKLKKGKVFGCVDTQSIEFSIGNLNAPEKQRGGIAGIKQAPGAFADIQSLEMVGNVVSKVGDLLNKTMEIHQKTIMFSDAIKEEAEKNGYEKRKKEEESEQMIKSLTERLNRLEQGQSTPPIEKAPEKEENSLLQSILSIAQPLLNEAGIIPAGVDLSSLDPETLKNLVSGIVKNKVQGAAKQ